MVVNKMSPTISGIAASAIPTASAAAGCRTLSVISAPMTARPVPSFTQPGVRGGEGGVAELAGLGVRSDIALPD